MRVFRTKIFSFSIIRGPIDVPPVLAGDYTPEQTAAFQEQFKPLAAAYRRRLRRVGWSIAGVIPVAIALGYLLPASVTVFVALGGFAAFLLIGVCFWPTVPPCPACHSPLDRTIAEFCPECGSFEIENILSLLQPPRCITCGHRLGSDRSGRQYKIRCCTYCGVKLDEKGL